MTQHQTFIDMLQGYAASVTLLEWTIIGIILLGIVIWLLWEQLKFFALRVNYGMPLVGKTRRLAKNDSTTGRWFNAERRLCADFNNHINNSKIKDVKEYRKSVDYLSKTTEIGRRPLPLWGWVLILALTGVEAAGFSYVIAGFISMEASERWQEYMAYALAAALAVAYVWITHTAGQQLHRNGLLTAARDLWRKDPDKEQSEKFKVSQNDITLDNTYEDDKHKSYQQVLNRLSGENTKKYWAIIAAVLLVVIMSVLATWVRGKGLENEINQQVTSSNQMNKMFAPDQSQLPGNMGQIEQHAKAQEKKDTRRAFKQMGWGAFIVLALIFVLIQVVGVLAGFFWSFSGKESHSAWRGLDGCSTEEAFERKQKSKSEPTARVAQANLSDLQSRLAETAGSEAIRNAGERTFSAYRLEEFKRMIDEQKWTAKMEREARLVEAEPALKGGHTGDGGAGMVATQNEGRANEISESDSIKASAPSFDTTTPSHLDKLDSARRAQLMKEIAEEDAAKHRNEHDELSDEQYKELLRQEMQLQGGES